MHLVEGLIVAHPGTGQLGIVSDIKLSNIIVLVGKHNRKQCWPINCEVVGKTLKLIEEDVQSGM